MKKSLVSSSDIPKTIEHKYGEETYTFKVVVGNYGINAYALTLDKVGIVVSANLMVWVGYKMVGVGRDIEDSLNIGIDHARHQASKARGGE